MAKKIRMPLGTRIRSGLKELARGKKGLKPRPRKRREKAAAATFRMLTGLRYRGGALLKGRTGDVGQAG